VLETLLFLRVTRRHIVHLDLLLALAKLEARFRVRLWLLDLRRSSLLLFIRFDKIGADVQLVRLFAEIDDGRFLIQLLLRNSLQEGRLLVTDVLVPQLLC
jgi:hypothetical protein